MIQLDGRSLDLEVLARVAREPGARKVGVADAATTRLVASTDLRRKLVADRLPIYGVTTGFGDNCTTWIPPELAADLQRDLVRYHLNGAGPAVPAEVVRAMILIRANCLAQGVSGVRPAVIDQLLAFVEHDIVPEIPEWGSVGASGDLVPLCYLAAALLGEGEVRHRDESRPAADVLADLGLTPLELEPKEGLALINGTSFMAAYAALATVDVDELVFAAELCTALASQALLGNRGHFADFGARHKPHPGQAASTSAIAGLLTGSLLGTAGPAGVDPQPEDESHKLDRHIQDRYSVRCSPHVVGVLRDTMDWVRRWVEIEINSATDNPLFDTETGSAYSGGNFYGGHIAQAMDALKTAVASVGDLLDRQLALIVDEKFSNGLPANLAATNGRGDAPAGLSHGYKGMQIACSAFAAEALHRASPASMFSRSTEAHNQDKVNMGSIAARDARTVIELVTHVAAVCLHALCQAADHRSADRLSPVTRRAYELVRSHVPFLDRDRRLDAELRWLVGTIRSGELRRACDQAAQQPTGSRATFTKPSPRPAATHQSHDWDAIVVGGGPAGSIAALVLARRGRRVLLLERSRFPRFHIGESMLSYSAALFQQLGIEQAVREAGFPIKSGAEFTGQDASHRRVDFTAQDGGRVLTTYQVERADFDKLLLDQAAAAGAVVRQGVRVHRPVTDSAGRIIGVTCTDEDDSAYTVRAPVVIDASGRAGLIANQHLKAREVCDRLRMVALFRHFADVDEATNPGVAGDIQIGSHPDGWVWAIPIRPGKLSVGAVTRPETVRGADRDALYADHVNRIPRIRQRLAGARSITDVRGESDFSYFTETVAGPGFFVVGDAACFVDPIFSAGVYLAMTVGRRAAELTADLLAGRIDEAVATQTYSRFCKTGYDCYFRLIYTFYESGFRIGPYLRSTGFHVEERWIARLLGGDFWSRKNPLAQHLRAATRLNTFAPFEPLYGCPVYPDLDRTEPADAPLGAPREEIRAAGRDHRS
jgi:phenylalanine ammonia-lyase